MLRKLRVVLELPLSKKQAFDILQAALTLFAVWPSKAWFALAFVGVLHTDTDRIILAWLTFTLIVIYQTRIIVDY